MLKTLQHDVLLTEHLLVLQQYIQHLNDTDAESAATSSCIYYFTLASLRLAMLHCSVSNQCAYQCA
jgi:hypothetical protein